MVSESVIPGRWHVRILVSQKMAPSHPGIHHFVRVAITRLPGGGHMRARSASIQKIRPLPQHPYPLVAPYSYVVTWRPSHRAGHMPETQTRAPAGRLPAGAAGNDGGRVEAGDALRPRLALKKFLALSVTSNLWREN